MIFCFDKPAISYIFQFRKKQQVYIVFSLELKKKITFLLGLIAGVIFECHLFPILPKENLLFALPISI